VSRLGAWERAVRRARRRLGEDRWRMGRVGGVERSPEIPCIVHFRPRTGAKMGAGHRSCLLSVQIVVDLGEEGLGLYGTVINICLYPITLE